MPNFQEKLDAGIEDVFDIANFYGHGASAADFDGDGDIDFYLATTSGDRDRIYKNDGHGVFINVTDALGVDIRTGSRMGIWFDYNNDHRLDLVILGERCATFFCGNPILINLLQQTEQGTFEDVTLEANLNLGDKYVITETYAAGGMAAGDINNDGLLDLLVTVWGAQPSLFLNNGDGTFDDISESSEVGKESFYFWQPMFHDFNDDGFADIYMNVDFDRNQLWINWGDLTFYETASKVGLASDFSEMGMSINDYDNDGDFDIYATNITREFQGSDEHNVLLRNDSEAGFMVYNDIGVNAGVGSAGWDWGNTFFDANNDGWVDLASTNGWNNDPLWEADQSHFWMNSLGSFSDRSSASNFNDTLSATTLIAFDIDRDGDLDLLQTLKDNPNTKRPAIVYENLVNEEASFRNYLVIKPRMKDTNHWAIGAEIKVRATEYFNMRLISAGTSFYGQEPSEAFFGLRDLTSVAEVEILWPDGTVSIYEDITANQVIELQNEIIQAPSDLNYSFDTGELTLTWTDNSDNETGFRIEKSADKAFDVVESLILSKDITEYKAAFDGTHPYFRIKAVNQFVTSPYSNYVRASTSITSILDDWTDSFKLYPNPSNGKFNIEINSSYYGSCFLTMYNHAGKEVKSFVINKLKPIASLQIDLHNQPGLYIIIIKSLTGSAIYISKIQIIG